MRSETPHSDELPSPGTRERLLDAAERLFADAGIAATSLRQITAEAEANLAAVNYHFGSKQALIEEVFARRLRPLNAERLSRLQTIESSECPPALERILEAFLEPAFLIRRDRGRGGPDFVRLMGRAHSEASREIRKAVFAQFEEVILRFADAITRAVPALTPREVAWRLEFSIGAMAFTLADPPAFRSLTTRGEEEEGEERAVGRLVAFLAAGFLAPSSEARS